jgi:hypothetical protein
MKFAHCRCGVCLPYSRKAVQLVSVTVSDNAFRVGD